MRTVLYPHTPQGAHDMGCCHLQPPTLPLQVCLPKVTEREVTPDETPVSNPLPITTTCLSGWTSPPLPFFCRWLYQILTYFFFFYNVIFGFVMCFLRVFAVLIFTVVMLFRLDWDVYMRGLEGWDTGLFRDALLSDHCQHDNKHFYQDNIGRFCISGSQFQL